MAAVRLASLPARRAKRGAEKEQAQHASQSVADRSKERTKDKGCCRDGTRPVMGEEAQAAAQEANLKGEQGASQWRGAGSEHKGTAHRWVEYTQATDSTTGTEVCEWASKGQ